MRFELGREGMAAATPNQHITASSSLRPALLHSLKTPFFPRPKQIFKNSPLKVQIPLSGVCVVWCTVINYIFVSEGLIKK